jgi:hypothetical protein
MEDLDDLDDLEFDMSDLDSPKPKKMRKTQSYAMQSDTLNPQIKKAKKSVTLG